MTASTPIKVLANATEFIELLAWDGPQSPADIAARISMPRSSVYRLIEGLEATSMIESMPDSRVRLSSRWLHLADSARAAMVEWGDAGAVLDRMVDETGQTAFLSVRRGDRAVCIDWRQGRGIGVLALKPGRSLPLYAGAAGRVLLAFSDAESVLDASPHPALTPRTLVTREALEADVEVTREQGYVLSDEDVTPGIGAVGVPLWSDDGVLLGALSLGGVRGEIRGQLDSARAALAQAAAELAASRRSRMA